jgi:hypothetical protein
MRPLGVLAVLALGGTVLCSGCGSSTVAGTASPRAAVSPPAVLSLAESQATSQSTWAVLPMGAASGPNQFWQLFLLAAGRPKWTLDTPPDVATNGALALGGLSGTSLVAGVRPSLNLAFSPVSQTGDGGQHWTAGPPAAGLASVPDALAGTPGGRRLLAVSTTGQVSAASAAGTQWTPLVTERTLAATAAGRSCGLSQLTAVAYSAAAIPMLAGSCSQPGVAGIFAAGKSWGAAGPPLPSSLAGYRVRVLRLVTVGSGTVALLQADNGSRSELAAAWLYQRGRWMLSPVLSLAGSAVRTTAFGSSGAVAVVLSGGRGEILSGPGGSWRQTPPVPAGRTVTIALPGVGLADALAASAGTLTVWRLGGSGDGWTEVQTLKVPIQYGSSH